MIYSKCTHCGHAIKNISYFNNKPYGLDCFEVVAAEFIKLRDAIAAEPFNPVTSPTKIERMNKLALKYGVYA